ncbi:MAG: GNAT family N-acetyltransferase, partial [Actinomycetota bacterium]|nr:GNAT family N-acetyltransferase [Actinomycetota bacterium]
SSERATGWSIEPGSSPASRRSMNDEFRRTVEFEKATAAAASTRHEDVGVGTLYVNSHLPGVWDRNFIRLDERARGSSASDLAALADDLLRSAGAEHRKIFATPPDIDEDTLEEFDDLGWNRTDLATMAHRDRSKLRVRNGVVELDVVSYIPFQSACVDAFPASDPKVKDQLVSLVPLMADHARARFFAVKDGDDIVSGCHLYSDGDVAQVEDVMTLEPYRKRGYAAAVVSRATREAIAARHSLVFLIVEQEGGARRLYEKLGFDTIGKTVELAREPR